MALLPRPPLRLLVPAIAVVAAVAVVRPSFLPRVGGADAVPVSPHCYFQFDMRLLRSEIPNQVGDCLENQHYNPENGDTLQRTTGGLMVWRKTDHVVAFTDGSRTWAHGPNGLETRSNDQRFEWEATPESAAASSTTVVRPAPPPAASKPAVAPTPTPRSVVVTTPEAQASSTLAGIAAAIPNTNELIASATEMVIVSSLKSSGLPVQNVQALNADNDPAHQLGKPGQYSSKIVWRDARANAEDSTLEMFPDEAALRVAFQALDAAPRTSPQYTPYVFADPPHKTLIRLPKALTPDQAQGYQRWLTTLK